MADAGPGHYLLIRRSISNGERVPPVLVAPRRDNGRPVVKVAGARWAMEECFRAAKNAAVAGLAAVAAVGRALSIELVCARHLSRRREPSTSARSSRPARGTASRACRQVAPRPLARTCLARRRGARQCAVAVRIRRQIRVGRVAGRVLGGRAPDR